MQTPASAPRQPSGALQVSLIPVLQDNYVFVWHEAPPGRAVVVDPAVGPAVIDWLERHRLDLVAVLQTHHHADHIGGTPALLRRWPAAAVIAAAADRKRIPFQTHSVAGGDHFELLGREVQVLSVPGHTRAHVAYLLPAVPGGETELFCGDTLFAGGCGRLFEGTAAEMHASLRQLAALPDSTRVWCAHEYTLANLRWAAGIADPSATEAVAARLTAVERQRRENRSTVPTTIGEEKASNLFLRARSSEELAALRRDKDHWRG